MNPSEVSRTALATAMMRAAHSRSDPAPLLDDDWGYRLVPDVVRAAFRQAALDRMNPDDRAKALSAPASFFDGLFRANPAYADVIIRARYTEDALQAAVARGIEQYVIIGAGFDSFACRRPAYASQMNVFEVDHPATQALKRKRLADCNVAASDLLHFVAADLSAEDLQTALGRSSFDPARPTFFSWLGVTIYLTREANLATLRAIASCAPEGSELVFTYVDQVAFDPDHAATESFRKLGAEVSSVGEAFLSGFDPGAIGGQLLGVGLRLLEDLNGEQMVQRYDPAGVNRLRSNLAAHIAHARVVRVPTSGAV
jgi:methyltransferase (TIGR00027 family)